MDSLVGFGLAPVKAEGEALSYDESYPADSKHKPTRWIEMCYDPEESMSHVDLEPFREMFQTQQLCNSYTEDDMYLIIKALANEFIKSEH